MTVTVQAIYPNSEGATFDFDYYVGKHLPLVRKLLAPKGLAAIAVSRGLPSGPDAPPKYLAVCTMTFPDEAALAAALGEAGPLIVGVGGALSIVYTSSVVGV